jgi:hypothetical protein
VLLPPAIFDGYLDGTLIETLEARVLHYQFGNIERMSGQEAAVAAFLRLRLKVARVTGRNAPDPWEPLL